MTLFQHLTGHHICKIALGAMFIAALSACNSLPESQTQEIESQATVSAAKGSFDPFGTEEEKPHLGIRRKNAPPPTRAELMKPSPLDVRFLGAKNAPITMIEYASLTCPVCRKFHIQTFPAFKRKYIKTGKVRYIMREFPIGHASGVATLAMRCTSNNRDYFKLYDAYLTKQRRWVALKIKYDAIYKIAQQTTGMSRAKFDSCVNNKKLAADLTVIKQDGRELGVIGTPSFFINGKPLRGAKTLAEMDAVIQPMLSGKTAKTH